MTRPLVKSTCKQILPLTVAFVLLILTLPLAFFWLEDQSWIINNDHLAPFDYLQQLVLGEISWGDITHARIPSVWPDYVIAGISLAIFGQGESSFVAAWLFQFSLAVLGLILLSYSLGLSKQSAIIFATAISFLFLISLSSQLRDIIIASGIPARHGGNWINFTLILCLAIPIVTKAKQQNRFTLYLRLLLILGLTMASTFSNRLIFVQLTLPTALLYLISISLSNHPSVRDSRPFKVFRKRLQIVLASITFGSILGLFQYFLSMHQCEEVQLTNNFNDIISLWKAGRLDQPGVWLLIVNVLMLLMGIKWIFENFFRLQKSPEQVANSQPVLELLRVRVAIVFFSLSSTLSICAYYSVSENLLDPSLWRYLLTPSYLLAISLALLIFPILNKQNSSFTCIDKLSKFLLRPVTFLIILLFMSLESLVFIQRLSARYQRDHHDQLRWLEASLVKHGLSSQLGFVADPPWESRRIELASKRSIRALSISTDGNPRIHPHSRVQFIKSENYERRMNPSPSQVVSPSWVLTSEKDFDRMVAFYGPPHQQISCFRSKGCLYIFDKTQINNNTSTFLSTWHFEQHGCLKGSREQFRSKIISLLKRISFVRYL